MKRKIAKSIVLVQIAAVLCGIYMFCFGCGEPNPYAVYKAGEHGLISLGPNSEGVSEITFREESKLHIIRAVPDYGYDFDCWSDGVTSVIRSDSFDRKKSVNVTAYFKPKEYKVIYKCDYGGRFSFDSTPEQLVKHGEASEKVEAVPLDGWQFDRWSDGLKEPVRYEKSVTNYTEITAHFSRKKNTQRYVIMGDGAYFECKLNEDGTSYNYIKEQTVSFYGDTVHNNPYTLHIWLKPGYEFVGWSDGVKTLNRACYFTNYDFTVYAVFNLIVYNVNYQANGGGKIEGEQNQELHYGEDAKSVTAVPNEGYRFVCWSDRVYSPTRQDLAIEKDIRVTAIFTLNREIS